MPKGIAKSKYNFTINENNGKEIGCTYENHSWCKLPKYKRCENCIRCDNGDKACEVTAL